MRIPSLAAILTAALIAATPSVTYAAGAEEFNRCGYSVNTKALHLRTGPSTGHKAIGLLHRGDWVHGEKTRGQWWQVRLATPSQSGLQEGSQGWLAKKHLAKKICMQLD